MPAVHESTLWIAQQILLAESRLAPRAAGVRIADQPSNLVETLRVARRCRAIILQFRGYVGRGQHWRGNGGLRFAYSATGCVCSREPQTKANTPLPFPSSTPFFVPFHFSFLFLVFFPRQPVFTTSSRARFRTCLPFSRQRGMG